MHIGFTLHEPLAAMMLNFFGFSANFGWYGKEFVLFNYTLNMIWVTIHYKNEDSSVDFAHCMPHVKQMAACKLCITKYVSKHECLSIVSIVCCQVEVSATDWLLVRRSPTDCGASLCVIKKPRKRGG
jgi:hypothetical protein